MIGALNNMNIIHHGPCAHCRTDLKYIAFEQIKVVKRKKYCSQKCLTDHYKSLNYKGAVHHVHQMFGPDHPVTKQIQAMHKELKEFRKGFDEKKHAERGREYFRKYLEKANKCL